jgi:hypothetical protein
MKLGVLLHNSTRLSIAGCPQIKNQHLGSRSRLYTYSTLVVIRHNIIIWMWIAGVKWKYENTLMFCYRGPTPCWLLGSTTLMQHTQQVYSMANSQPPLVKSKGFSFSKDPIKDRPQRRFTTPFNISLSSLLIIHYLVYIISYHSIHLPPPSILLLLIPSSISPSFFLFFNQKLIPRWVSEQI